MSGHILTANAQWLAWLTLAIPLDVSAFFGVRWLHRRFRVVRR